MPRRSRRCRRSAADTWLRLGLVGGRRPDFKISESRGAERICQALGIAYHHEGQIVGVNEGAVRLGSCLWSHRTQQRQTSVDVIVGKPGENLSRSLVGDPVGRGVAQR